MKVKSIAECSLGAFCNTFDLHKAIICLENQFLVFFLSGRLRQVLLYYMVETNHGYVQEVSQITRMWHQEKNIQNQSQTYK